MSCEQEEADGVLGSNFVKAWQIVLGNKDKFAGVVEMVEITQEEYEKLAKEYPKEASQEFIDGIIAEVQSE